MAILLGHTRMKKQHHLKLLADAFFDNIYRHEDSMTIGLDFRRPFGNSFVAGDILEIIKLKHDSTDEDGVSCYAEELISYVLGLYDELVLYLRDQWFSKFGRGVR